MSKIKLLKGNNIELLKTLPENSIDSIVTDPPYGLSFMGKKWDYDVPSVQFWKEAYRVLKPGGHILSFGGTRTYHRMVVNMEDAGFEIRDQIMWLYGSGFPKSLNIGKAVDKINGVEGEQGPLKRGGEALTYDSSNYGDIDWKADKRDPYTYIAKNEWEGWGTALKPANEPICLARKPLSEKTVADNVLKWKTGGLNIDGCRVGNEAHIVRGTNISGKIGEDQFNRVGDDRNFDGMNKEVEGRFPANIILECICDEVIKGERGEVRKSGFRVGGKSENSVGLNGIKNAPDNYNDKGDIHTNPMCPCYIMDSQSGVSKSSKRGPQLNKKGYKGDLYTPTDTDYRDDNTYGDKGGSSRFFYQAKVSKKERNMGLDLMEGKEVIRQGLAGENNNPVHKNSHPTVKPVSLMAYLCKLVTPPGGIVLDPFMGSGSTGIAAQLQGFRFCGMEMDGDYFKIAEARINDYEKYREFLKGK
jgi:DNA modification methylase